MFVLGRDKAVEISSLQHFFLYVWKKTNLGEQFKTSFLMGIVTTEEIIYLQPQL